MGEVISICSRQKQEPRPVSSSASGNAGLRNPYGNAEQCTHFFNNKDEPHEWWECRRVRTIHENQ